MKKLLLALALTACVDQPAYEEQIHGECGEMPPDPHIELTVLPGTGADVCMNDKVYINMDLRRQALRDWAVCIEIQLCKARGECL